MLKPRDLSNSGNGHQQGMVRLSLEILDRLCLLGCIELRKLGPFPCRKVKDDHKLRRSMTLRGYLRGQSWSKIRPDTLVLVPVGVAVELVSKL